MLVLALTVTGLRSEDGTDGAQWQALFNGKDTQGWKLREEAISVLRFVDSTGKPLTGARSSMVGQQEVVEDDQGKTVPRAKVAILSGKKVAVDAFGKVLPQARIKAVGGREAIIDSQGAVIHGAKMITEKKRNTSGWKVVNQELRCVEPHVGNDLVSERTFHDFELHVEFQATGNSGVYLQGRYEIQVDNSQGQKPRVVDKDGKKVEVFDPHQCGAIYGQVAPSKNMAKAPTEWQTYDVVFRAPRGDRGKVKEKARVTLHWNGEKVIDNAVIDGLTGGALDANVLRPGPVVLQGDHGRVAYRNIKVRAIPVE